MARNNDNNNDRPRGPRGPRRPEGPGNERPGRGGFKGRRDDDGGRPRASRASDSRPARGEGKSGFGGKRQFGEARGFGDKRRSDDRQEGARKRSFGEKREHGERPSRGPRKDFRSGERSERPRFDRPRDDRAPRSGGERGGWRDHPRSDRPREDRPHGDRSHGDRPRGDRPRSDRPQGDRPHGDRPRSDRPRAEHARGEHVRSERPRRDDRADRPYRGSRDDRPSRAPRDERGGEDRPRRTHYRSEGPRLDRDDERYVKRPFREDRLNDSKPRGSRKEFSRKDFSREDAEGGREPSRRNFARDRDRGDDRPPRRDSERAPRREFDRAPRGDFKRGPRDDFDRDERPAAAPRAKKKVGERIAKIVARAGMCSRRDAEEWITQGRVAVNGRVITSPALDVAAHDVVTIDGAPLPARERTRLFLYHKPRGLVTTHADPEGRPTVFDALPKDLPRLISVGRLDFNTEGLLLLTNDGGLARALELPETGWLRRYRVRAHGRIDQAQLDSLRHGISIEGVNYGAIDASLDREQGANVWITFAIREGKNREVRNVLAHLGLDVNRLIRVSYGPFQLGELAEGAVEEIKTRVLREQLGEKVAKLAGADFDSPVRADDEEPAPRRSEKPAKTKRAGLIADRKGRRVLVERTRKDETDDDGGPSHRPSRRPPRHYHGKNERGGERSGGRPGGQSPRKR